MDEKLKFIGGTNKLSIEKLTEDLTKKTKQKEKP